MVGKVIPPAFVLVEIMLVYHNHCFSSLLYSQVFLWQQERHMEIMLLGGYNEVNGNL